MTRIFLNICVSTVNVISEVLDMHAHIEKSSCLALNIKDN
jgi:hypothetical protein